MELLFSAAERTRSEGISHMAGSRRLTEQTLESSSRVEWFMMSHAGPMNIADSILDRQTRGVFFSARAGCDPKGSRTCRPRIGVLPPEAVNGSDGEKRLATGLASEIATTLIPGLADQNPVRPVRNQARFA